MAMATDSDIRETVRRYLRDARASWSIGSFGAIAEFHRDAGELLGLNVLDRPAITTDRGAIWIDIQGPVLPLAYETLSRRPERWQHGVVFCLPDSRAAGNVRTAITELGADRDAIREKDRSAILFDVGLGAANVDFCVRTPDETLIALLRDQTGHSVLEPGSRAMRAIVDASPHRVAISRLGRIEVYQAISREKTPAGPHTHVLPKFLKGRRTHSANIPVPPGFLPCLSHYPANPLAAADGAGVSFDARKHDDFQALLAAWGPALYCREKQRALQAFRDGLAPADYMPHRSRLGRTAMRIAIRQLRYTNPDDASLVASWIDQFDRPRRPAGG